MKKNLLITTLLALLLAFVLAGCTTDPADHPTNLRAPQGEEVFGKYVAVGNSLTAGYEDGGLVGFTSLGLPTGQYYSYPRLIAGQLGLDNSIGDSQFSQPYVAWPGVGSSPASDPANAAGVMYFDGATGGLMWEETPQVAIPGLLLAATIPTPYHNLGVPGARLWEVLNTYDSTTSYGAPYGSPNPFFDFINRASFFGNVTEHATVTDVNGLLEDITYETASMARQAIAKGPSLATVWIGNNDVLGGATGGNPIVGDDPLTGGNITTPETFQAQYSEMMQVLAGGMVQSTGFAPLILAANIPSITSIPYFIDETSFLAAVGAAAWPAGYEDADVQLFTFPVLSWAAMADPMTDPVPSDYTLTTTEVATVDGIVDGFNQIIAGVAASITASDYARVEVVDMNALMNDLASGTSQYGPYAAINFLLLLPQFAGDIQAAADATLFSLDGVHPNNKGYGVVANEFINVLNDALGTSVPPVDVASLHWDPTYGKGSKVATSGVHLSPEAAARMSAIFR